MHEKFNDPVKAVCYVTTGLFDDYPKGAVEIIYLSGSKTRRQTCATREAGHHLQVFCRKFPRASVYYYPENADGIVAEMRCHCEVHIKKHCCRHGKDRPRVMLRLVDVPATDEAVETSARVAAAFNTGKSPAVRVRPSAALDTEPDSPLVRRSPARI